MKTILAIPSPAFALGNVVATPGAMDAFTMQEQLECLARHAAGDWGDLCDDDKASNDAGVTQGSRLLSAYTIRGKKLWLLTERDRSTTTLLLPSEY